MRGVDVAQAARQHDGLVVAAEDPTDLGFEAAEVAAQVRPAELVIERGGADRSLEHDLERGGDALGLARRGAFPLLLVSRDTQVGYRVADQPRLRLRAPPGRPLVADLAARAGRCPRKRRDRGRVIMRLDLHHVVPRGVMAPVAATAARMYALRLAP